MYVLIVAAAAEYITKHLKNFTRCKHYLSDLSSATASANFDRHEPLSNKPESSASCSVLPKNKLVKENKAPVTEMASTSGFGGEDIVALDNLLICSTSSNANLLPGFLNNQEIQDWEAGGENMDNIHSDISPQLSARGMGFPYGVERNRSKLRARRTNGQVIKPLTSLESCLMAQLYKELPEIEEYTFSAMPSPKTPTARPFIITDGSRIISRAGYESFGSRSGTGKYIMQRNNCSQNAEVVLGIPRIPKVASMESHNRGKPGKEKVARMTNSSKLVNGNTHNSPEGSFGGAYSFYLGFSVGMISSFLAHKRETEKLMALLRQTENLVQDLQEELEMKDSLTMKEIAVENYVPKDVDSDYKDKGTVHALSPEQKLDESTKYCCEEYDEQKANDISLSNIEAELEAELERLELNMNSSKLEKKISNLAQVDKDFIADVAEGELREDLFDKRYADRDGTGCSTPCSVHYAVSPRELSLRLHQVIQSQLEERVRELEIALENSQRKIKHSNGAESCEDSSPDGPPAVINLMGEALSAYNEAYDEFSKGSESDEENQYMQHSFSNESLSLGDENGGDGDGDDGEEEMERLLIKQIVEKARKGSPAVILNAKRVLYEYQH